MWSDHNNPSPDPDSAHSDDIISVQCSQVSGCRRESSWQQVLPRVRERESCDGPAVGVRSVSTFGPGVCHQSPGPSSRPVSCSRVFTLSPLHLIVTTVTVTSGDGMISLLKLSVIIPLHHYAASVWEENEEWGIAIEWDGAEWESDESHFEAIKHQPAPAATGLGPAAASQALAVLWDCEVIY